MTMQPCSRHWSEPKPAQAGPNLTIAHMMKGKGVCIAENNPACHSRAPKGEK